MPPGVRRLPLWRPETSRVGGADSVLSYLLGGSAARGEEGKRGVDINRNNADGAYRKEPGRLFRVYGRRPGKAESVVGRNSSALKVVIGTNGAGL
jgi:hypothetical protein